MTVVHRPPVTHVCHPGWHTEHHEQKPGLQGGFPSPPTGDYWVEDRPWPTEGTVVQCECGRTWVAWYEANGGQSRYAEIVQTSGVWLGPRWRPEGRFERWRRERRVRVIGSAHTVVGGNRG